MTFYWSQTVTPGAERLGGHARHEVFLGFTDRAGGVSEPPYDTLNLGGHVGDDPRAVATNRERLASELGVEPDRLLMLNQCHGDAVEVATGPWPGAAPVADGMITDRAGLACAVLVADCVPVLLFDAIAGLVGAVHAGRPGMLARITEVAVRQLRERGAKQLEAVVGPSVCPRCYEVPEDMRAHAALVEPVSASVSREGTPAIDVAAGVVEQLRRAQVPTTWIPGCTREDERLYSHRRGAPTGRFAGVVLLRPPGGLPG